MIFYENVFIAVNRKATGAQAKKIDDPAISWADAWSVIIL